MNPALLLTILLFASGYSSSAYAYLDPGAGSFILQMLIASIMGMIITLKFYWYRLIAFLKRCLGKSADDKNNRPDENDSQAD